MATLRLASRRLAPRRPPLDRRNASSASTPARAPLRTGLYAAALAASAGLFAVYYSDSRAALHRYVLTPVLRHAVDAETSHKLAVRLLRLGLGPRDTRADDEVLQTELWGQTLANPIGLAAGFDKHGEAIDGLFDLGFSWVEIGSVTPKPQPGNPPPRVFHLPGDDALINRYGFPSEGHAAVLARLRARAPRFPAADEPAPAPASYRAAALLAVNLGKNKTSPVEAPDDFVAGVHAFGPHADVLVVNVSSPNTPGLRGLQTRALLEELLASVAQARDELAVLGPRVRRPRLVLKIAPDLSDAELADVGAVVRRGGVDGVIVSNTTVSRPASLTDPHRGEAGGLSGAPLRPLALAALRTLRAHVPAEVALIGCGGVASGADALAFARAGASCVQLYTSFGYGGAGACARVKDELAAELRGAGTSWGAVVREAVGRLSWREEAGEASVRQLVQEAEELGRLLDRLAEREGGAGAEGAAAVVPPVVEA